MSDLRETAIKAYKSGLSGAGSMVVQVSTLMWMRTIMNYQYRYGGTITHTAKTLYADGGIPRFYRGVSVALLQGPMSRFGDTFSNTLALSLCNDAPILKDAPIFVKTGFASITAGLFRIGLMPVDTVKTSLQVNGRDGMAILRDKMKTGGFRVFYNGSVATATATMVGHYPWFATYNYLNAYIPKYDASETLKNMGRNAGIGFTASVSSDTLSNSLRIVKTMKQSHPNPTISYLKITEEILAKDGYVGLFGRGLKMRLMTNGLQGMMFSVLWKYFETGNNH